MAWMVCNELHASWTSAFDWIGAFETASKLEMHVEGVLDVCVSHLVQDPTSPCISSVIDDWKATVIVTVRPCSCNDNW